MAYSGNGKLFIYRKALYTFFKEFTDRINWEETAVPEEYCSFNPREIYSLSIRIDENTVGYCYIMITGRRANLERPVTTNVRIFINLDGIDYTTAYMPMEATPQDMFDFVVNFILNGGN